MVEFDILTRKLCPQRRPMMLLAMALIGGLLLPERPFVGGVILLLCPLPSRTCTSLFSCLAMGCFGLALAVTSNLPSPGTVNNLPVESLFRFRGTLETIEPTRWSPYPTTNGYARLHSCQGDSQTVPIHGRVRIIIRGYRKGLFPGDHFDTLGILRSPRPASNPGEFDRVRAWRHRGTDRQLLISLPSAIQVTGQSDSLRSSIDRFRHNRKQQLSSQLPPDVSALASALLLGHRNPDLHPTSQIFRSAGISHLLAISGLHLGLLLGALSRLFRCLRVHSRIHPLLLLAALPGLVLLTGAAPPVVRSALVSAGALLAPLLGRRVDALNLLALAAILQLIPNPHLLDAPSFQLSYVASIGIVIASHPLRTLFEIHSNPSNRGLLRPILSALSTSLAAWTFTVPWTSFLFGRLVPFAPFASVLLLPIFTATLLVDSALLLLGWMDSFFLFPLIETSKCFSKIFIECAAFLSRIPSIATHRHVILPSLLAFACLILFLWCRKSHRVRLGFFLAAPWLTLTSLLLPPTPDSLAVTFLDVGQGSTAVVHLPGRRALIVDPGSSSITRVGKRVILPYLEASGVHTLIGIVVTHDDADHHNGVLSILQQFPGLPVWVSSRLARRAPTRIDRWKRSGGVPRIVSPNSPLLPPSPIEIWSPPEVAGQSDNDSSLVLRIHQRGQTVLLPGDLEERGIENLLRSTFLGSVQVLASPHHGAHLNNLDRLLSTARPDHFVVSARSGFSNLDDLLRASQMGIQVHTTWNRGAITVRWGEESIEISSFR